MIWLYVLLGLLAPWPAIILAGYLKSSISRLEDLTIENNPKFLYKHQIGDIIQNTLFYVHSIEIITDTNNGYYHYANIDGLLSQSQDKKILSVYGDLYFTPLIQIFRFDLEE